MYDLDPILRLKICCPMSCQFGMTKIVYVCSSVVLEAEYPE